MEIVLASVVGMDSVSPCRRYQPTLESVAPRQLWGTVLVLHTPTGKLTKCMDVRVIGDIPVLIVL